MFFQTAIRRFGKTGTGRWIDTDFILIWQNNRKFFQSFLGHTSILTINIAHIVTQAVY